MHVGVNSKEISNRIIWVGDYKRA